MGGHTLCGCDNCWSRARFIYLGRVNSASPHIFVMIGADIALRMDDVHAAAHEAPIGIPDNDEIIIVHGAPRPDNRSAINELTRMFGINLGRCRTMRFAPDAEYGMTVGDITPDSSLIGV